MIKMESHLGSIEISERYFLSLIGSALSDAFGVAGLSSAGRRGRTRGAGDSVRIKSETKHTWQNVGEEPAVVIFAVSPPSF